VTKRETDTFFKNTHQQRGGGWDKAVYGSEVHCATDRIFLRKVGGGYIFIHRLLQEYFASLAETTTKEVTQ